MAVTVKSTVVYHVRLCSPIERHHLHGGSYCLPLQDTEISETSKHLFLDPEVGVFAYVCKVSKHVLDYTSHATGASGFLGKLTDRVNTSFFVFFPSCTADLEP